MGFLSGIFKARDKPINALFIVSEIKMKDE